MKVSQIKQKLAANSWANPAERVNVLASLWRELTPITKNTIFGCVVAEPACLDMIVLKCLQLETSSIKLQCSRGMFQLEQITDETEIDIVGVNDHGSL